MFKTGDYVRFLNEKQEGVVTRIIDHQLVGVTIEGDFEITVLANEIVLVQKAESALRDELHETAMPLLPLRADQEEALYLSIIKDEKMQHLFHLYLINASLLQVNFNFYIQKKDLYEGINSGIIKSNIHQKISTHTLTELDQSWVFHFQVLYFNEGEFQPRQPQVIRKQIKAKQVISTEKDIPLMQAKGFVVKLETEQEQYINPELLKEKMSGSTKEINDIHLPAKEIDLHIEELTEDFTKMNADEMLRFQLETFRRSLEAAISHHYSNIIFIHGVGNGTLRNEIHKQLGKHPHVKTFKDARKEKFGYGATEVILK